MKKLFSAGLVLFRLMNDQRYYLLLHYPHGHWDFPKGKIEEGESAQEAATRELKEETGLAAKIIKGFKKRVSYLFQEGDELIKKNVIFFMGQTSSETVTLSSEHVDFIWLPYNQAEDQLTFANAKELLTKAELFLRFHPNELF